MPSLPPVITQCRSTQASFVSLLTHSNTIRSFTIVVQIHEFWHKSGVL